MSVDTEYETHLTLAASDLNILNHVSEWAGSQDLKWTHIVLDAGKTPSQPMITFWGKGVIATQKDRAQLLSSQVARMGASVVRVKIETRAENACETPDGVLENGYVENHIKLLLAGDIELDDLHGLVIPHGARLSRNVRRVRTDGQQERFVTQRIYDADLDSSQIQFDRLMADLQRADYAIVEVERELVVFDSHLALDAGWL